MLTRNRENVIINKYQGSFKKVLCICSAGCLRSPTAAVVLANDAFGFNTRAVGIDIHHAIIPIDEGLVHWADEFVVMEEHQVSQLREFIKQVAPDTWELILEHKRIVNLEIPDMFQYRDPKLVSMIKKSYVEKEQL